MPDLTPTRAHLDALEQELSTVRAEQQALLSETHLRVRELLASCGLRNRWTP